ncbi:MAG TPA: tyrosine-type recombinase/integrase [Bryobacteraceae bacterium]|nr:tyrosine-type recombinase/integrase [Bryobacteraceae bacterium]
MTGCIFKRKLKSGIRWGYLFFGGWDGNGKRIQIFKSGFPTKDAASKAARRAIDDYEAAHGRVGRDIGSEGRRTWSYSLRELTQEGFETKEDAERALSDAVRRRDAEKARQAADAEKSIGPPVGRYLDYWLREHASRRCAPKTLERYRELAAYLDREVGLIRLNELTTAEIQEAIHRLLDHGGQRTKDQPNGKPLAPKTVRHIGTMLYTALADADRLGMLKKHPMEKRRVLLPKLPKRRPPVLDEAKLRMLFERARSTRLYPFIVIAAATGCRRGELLALTWADLNFETGELTISKSLEQTRAGGLRVKSTKSEEPRELGVPEWAIAVLQVHRAEQQRDRLFFGAGYAGHDLIFCQPNGHYYSPDRLGARVVELMRKVGLQGVSLHSLRHSHASILLSKGVPAAVVAERLGHSDQNITLSIYSHALPADSRAAARIWNNAVARVVNEAPAKLPPAKAEGTRMLANVCTGDAKKT